MKKLFVICCLILAIEGGKSQELRCNVQVLSQQIQGTNKQVFRTLQQAIYEFMNNRNWTNHVYKQEERIECNIMINITDQIGADEFKGTMQIQSRRPVYNTSYNTVILNYMDENIHFKYVEFEPLDFSETSHISNLTSLLAYYAYIILGFDYDTFGYEGGTELFKIAERIVNNAQNAAEKGWKDFEAKKHDNRYWLVRSILDEEYSPIREFYYQYHRLGLDIMESKLVEGRMQIIESLVLLQNVNRKKPDQFMHFLRVVLDAKADEFVNVFQEGSQDEKTRVQRILKEIDPANSSKYDKITQEKAG